MSRDAVAARLSLHAAVAAEACPSMAGKNVTPHVLRHTAAMRLLHAGIDWFRCNGWPLHGFVAPAWLLGAASWQPLRDLGFDYTCTAGCVVLLLGHGSRP